MQIASIAQNQARVLNQEHAEIVNTDATIKSKNDQVKAELKLAKLYMGIREESESQANMIRLKKIMAEIHDIKLV